MDKQYIHRMLAYWDPWGLITNSGAPENEYDSYITEIEELCVLESYDEIYTRVLTIFSQDGMPIENQNRSSAGIAEGILFYKNIIK